MCRWRRAQSISATTAVPGGGPPRPPREHGSLRPDPRPSPCRRSPPRHRRSGACRCRPAARRRPGRRRSRRAGCRARRPPSPSSRSDGDRGRRGKAAPWPRPSLANPPRNCNAGDKIARRTCGPLATSCRGAAPVTSRNCAARSSRPPPAGLGKPLEALWACRARRVGPRAPDRDVGEGRDAAGCTPSSTARKAIATTRGTGTGRRSIRVRGVARGRMDGDRRRDARAQRLERGVAPDEPAVDPVLPAPYPATSAAQRRARRPRTGPRPRSARARAPAARTARAAARTSTARRFAASGGPCRTANTPERGRGCPTMVAQSPAANTRSSEIDCGDSFTATNPAPSSATPSPRSHGSAAAPVAQTITSAAMRRPSAAIIAPGSIRAAGVARCRPIPARRECA